MPNEFPDPDVRKARKWGWREIVRCLLISAVAGLLAGGIVWPVTLYVAWKTTYMTDGIRPDQSLTQYLLQDEITTAISNYRSRHGSDPQSLDDLEISKPQWFDHSDSTVDGWHRPFIATSDGQSFVVTSYGRDGEPGGVGLDHDLTHPDPYPVGALLTFGQFMEQPEAERIRLWAMQAGILAAAAVFIIVLAITGTARMDAMRWGAVLFSLLVICLATTAVAGMISVLHVPMPDYHYTSGH